MMCRLRAVTLVVALAARPASSGAQPPSRVPSAQAALAEAEQLNKLMEKLYAEGTYQAAIVPAARALTLRENARGPDHPDVAESLNNLAELHRAQGEYAHAEPLFARALTIVVKARGPSHPDVATILNNLAALYQHQGAYAKAEPLYTRALAIDEQALGPGDPGVAIDVSNLAALYREQGAYAKAEPLFARALTINEHALGPGHPNVAVALNNLAVLRWCQGEYAKAEPLYTRALAIRDAVLGPGHPDVAISLDNLATLYRDQGEYAKAEPLYTRALAIRETVFGPSHPDVAIHLDHLAGMYRAQGAYAKAEPLLVRALAIRERAFGLGHPDVATSLNNLAALYRARGSHAKAEPLVARAADIQEQQLRTELVRLSESRKRALMSLLHDETESVVSLHADTMPSSTSALELALTTVLRRKGRILDSLVDSDMRIRSHLTPPLRELLDQLARTRSALVAQLYAATDAPARAAVAATRARIDELESALSAASAEFRTEVEPVTLAKIQAALPAGTALVELVRYRRDDPRRPQQQRWQEARYVAYLLTSGGGPQWVALGDAAPIDAQIDAALRAIHRKAPSDTTRAELQRLDALVLAPIRARLRGVSHLILAPDGKLNLVPFEALIDPQGHYALENYLVSYVTTGRDLLRSTPRSPRSSAVIIAGPDYGPLPTVRRSGTLAFAPLPGALAEATDLQSYFAAAPLTDADATKSALIALRGPAILHIATHGFYAGDPGPSPAPTARPLQASVRMLARRGISVDGSDSSSAPPARPDDRADALDRSGLAMAGANLGPAGIVTAREISGLDLWGTQLVVLSACETGVGAVASIDGVYGLRRALILAGAASQVVSLWSVSDSATPALMRAYYGHLARGIGRAEALRQAKREMLSQPRFAHPYYWAAFIPAGDWRPLDRPTFSPRKPTP